MLNLHLHGVPLCLSGITNPLSLSEEMADHDRRRKAMKKQREGLHAIANQQKGNFQKPFLEEHLILHDLFHPAKAA